MAAEGRTRLTSRGGMPAGMPSESLRSPASLTSSLYCRCAAWWDGWDFTVSEAKQQAWDPLSFTDSVLRPSMVPILLSSQIPSYSPSHPILTQPIPPYSILSNPNPFHPNPHPVPPHAASFVGGARSVTALTWRHETGCGA